MVLFSKQMPLRILRLGERIEIKGQAESPHQSLAVSDIDCGHVAKQLCRARSQIGG
jgi:hypothetical protein